MATATKKVTAKKVTAPKPVSKNYYGEPEFRNTDDRPGNISRKAGGGVAGGNPFAYDLLGSRKSEPKGTRSDSPSNIYRGPGGGNTKKAKPKVTATRSTHTASGGKVQVSAMRSAPRKVVKKS